MSVHLTEEEQIERIKALWKKYGTTVLTFVLGLAMLVFAWQWWSANQQTRNISASQAYEQLLVYKADEDVLGVELQSNYIIKTYPKSMYAELAGLFLAQQAVYSGNYADAAYQLSWVIEVTKNPDIRQIAELRLARVLIEQQQLEEALALLDTNDPDSVFSSLVAELRGDILLLQDKVQLARVEYARALAMLPELATVNPLLEMKLYSLPEPVESITDEESRAYEIPMLG